MLKWIVAPLLGGIIGYITNDLAIWMLFHPYREIYIGKWHVPFTPGLIPAQKERIAKGLGDLVSNQLLSSEVILKEALAPESLEQVRGGVLGFLEGLLAQERTLRELMQEKLPPERIEHYVRRAQDASSTYLMEKLIQAQVSRTIARSATDEIRERLSGNHALEGLMKLIRLEDILKSVEQTIARVVDRQLEQKGPALVDSQVEKVQRELLDRPVREMIAPYREKFPRLADKAVSVYRVAMRDHLAGMLRAAQIDGIVERRIESLDPAQIEKSAFQLMKRELNAIVYLGAALGFLLGFVNLLF